VRGMTAADALLAVASVGGKLWLDADSRGLQACAILVHGLHCLETPPELVGGFCRIAGLHSTVELVPG
jgi:hypothetical protein